MMKELIYKTIDVLKDKVRVNLLEIQNNQKEIRNLLKEPVSVDRSEKLEEKYALNKLLLAENNDFINVQLTLSNFIEKYHQSDIFEQKDNSSMAQQRSANDIFELTVRGDLNFDTQHPFYHDEQFYNRLLEYFQNREDYEKCQMLVKTRHKKSGLIG